MRPTHVLLLCESLALPGGVERFVCELADALVGRGLKVTLGSVDTPRERLAYPVGPNVSVVASGPPQLARTPRTRLGRMPQILGERWRAGRALGRVIDLVGADAIVLNGLVTACSVLVAKKSARPRSICCDHNHFTARSAIWQRLRAQLYPQVGAVVSLTEADRPKFAALNPHTQVILNTSSLSLINNSGADKAITFTVSDTGFVGPVTQFVTAGSGTWETYPARRHSPVPEPSGIDD